MKEDVDKKLHQATLDYHHGYISEKDLLDLTKLRNAVWEVDGRPQVETNATIKKLKDMLDLL